MPTTVTASRFNAIKTRIQSVLGASTTVSPTFGYGQTVNTPTVVGNYNTNTSSTSKIDDQQYRNLYIDLARARIHQVGSSAFSQTPFVVGDFETNTTNTDVVEEAYILGLESLMTQIETDRFLIHESTQGSLETLKNSAGFSLQGSRLQSSSGTWNRTLSYIFTVTFADATSRRNFFNAGGQIRISGNRVATTSSNSKSLDWSSLFSSVGKVSFAANSVYSTNSFGSGSVYGNYDLISSYRTIYTGTSSVYSGNYFRVYALENSATEIQFRVYFADVHSENIDEPIYGDFYVNVELLRPEGTATVNGVSTNTVTISTPPVGSAVTNLIQI